MKGNNKISDRAMDNALKDLNHCDDATHRLKKELKLNLGREEKKVSVATKEEINSLVLITRLLFQSLSVGFRRIESLLKVDVIGEG